MIETRNLSYQFRNSHKLFFPDLTIARSEHQLLLGQSGSGKTTLLHLLGGLRKIQEGDVSINGISLRSLSTAKLDYFRGQRIGFVFQSHHLISSLSVLDNLLVAPYLAKKEVSKERALRLLDHLGMAEKKHSKVSEISQGQAQRIAIARAMMNQPELVLADEPTSALDDVNCERVIGLLISLAEELKTTVVIATHDIRLKNFISRQINLDQVAV